MRAISRILYYIRRIGSYQFTIYAGNAAFFTILSLFPGALLLLTLVRVTPLSMEQLFSLFSNVVPANLQSAFSSLLDNVLSGSSPAIISVSAVAAAWSASRGVLGILNGVNAIYHVRDRRGYLRKRLLCLFYMVLLVVAIVLTLALHAFGQTLLSFIGRYLPGLYSVVALLLRLKFVVVIAFLSLLFTAMFYFFPNQKTTLRYSVPGAVTAAVGWVAFSELFSVYINYNRLSVLYGSVTTLILLMLWVYFSMSILMFGAVVNQLLRARTRPTSRISPSFSPKKSEKTGNAQKSSSNFTNSTNPVDF